MARRSRRTPRRRCPTRCGRSAACRHSSADCHYLMRQHDARGPHDVARGRGPRGVSRAMIAKIERAEAQPTAALLGRLSGALGITLSELIARAEHSDRRLARAADQPAWIDPDTGYTRRALSPASGGPLELVEVELPAGAQVSYPPDAY